MSGKNANLYDELFAADSFEQKQAKKAEKAQKLKLATQTQTKAGKAAEQKGFAPATGNKFVPVVDATRPEKRAYDRQSGTGRGKEVAKGGHSGWGKAVEKDEMHWHEAPVEQEEEERPKEKTEKKKEEPAKEEPKTEEVKTEEKKEEAKKQNPIAPPPRETLEQYEKRIRRQKNKLQVEKPKEVKEVESEVKLDGVAVMKHGKIQRTAPPPPPKKKPAAAEEKKDEEKELTTADFFEGVVPIRRGGRGGRGGFRGEGRGGFRGEGRGGFRGEGRGEFRGPRPEGESRGPRPEGEFRGPRPEGERRGPRPEGERRGPRPDGEFRGPRPEGERRPPRFEGERRGPRPEGDTDGPYEVHSRYVPGEKKEGAPATSAVPAPAPPRPAPYGGPRGPREHRPYSQPAAAPAPPKFTDADAFPSLGKK